MKRWLRRLGTTLLLISWLVVMAFPVVAFLLATQQQIQLGGTDGRHLRLFLLQEADAGGIGVEWSRSAGDNCLKTSIGYLLWDGDENGSAISYCRCLDPVTGLLAPAAVETCP